VQKAKGEKQGRKAGTKGRSQESESRSQNEWAETASTDFLFFWLLTSGFWILLLFIPAIRILHLTEKEGEGEYDMALKMKGKAAGRGRDLRVSNAASLSLQARGSGYCSVLKL
jgi:hypothetical protein